MKKLLLLLLFPMSLLGQVTPEQFAKGKTIGRGPIHTLKSAGYTVSSYAADFPRTNARSGYPVDLDKMTLDWACNQEAMFMMEDSAFTYFSTPGGKIYYSNHGFKLPVLIKSTQGRATLLTWNFEFNYSGYKVYNKEDFILFDSYPLDQTSAMQKLSYQYVFRNATLMGPGSKTENSIGIRIGGQVGGIFENLKVNSFGVGIKGEFALETCLNNVRMAGYGVYGMVLQNGKWTGAANSNAQSNIVTMSNLYFYNSPGGTPVAALYLNGNHTIRGDVMTFEGDKGSMSHIFYDNPGASGVNVFELSNVYMEYAGCSRAAIRIRCGKGQYILNQFRTSVVESDMPCQIEVEAVPVGGNWGSVHVFVNNTTTDTNKGKFRNMGNAAYGVNWYVSNYNMKNNTTFNSVENFDTSTPGSYLPKASDCRFTKPL